MRRLRYNVAASLDGYITDANGAYDWIPDDPAVDFTGLFANVDTIMLGRRTYEAYEAGRDQSETAWKADARVYVISRTLDPESVRGATVINDDPVALASALRHESGDGDIWLFGGGQLFATLLDGGQVDAVEVTVVPVLLGGGTPMLASVANRAPLVLTHSQVYPSGMVALHYSVPGARV